MSSVHFKSASELARLIRSKDISPLELMEETIKRIEAVNPAINAFVSMRAEQALDEARAMTERVASGQQLGPLAGIPIGVKDLEDVKGMVTSFGSTIYKNNIAGIDSVQASRLKAAGAIVVGKTNTPEFGFTGFTKNRVYGVTRNPWNTQRTPGGSSGGSAAVVTAGMVSLATGSDAGGSIRIPASYSGCVGLKTSAGRIPWGPSPLLFIYGIPVMGSLTRTVEDAALYLDCAAGYHPCDPASLPRPEQSYVQGLKKALPSLKIAFSPDLGYARVQKDVAARVKEAVQSFEDMGHRVELWEEPFLDVAETWSSLINLDLSFLYHQDIKNNRQEIGRTMLAALDQARSMSYEDKLKAQKVRSELNRIMWDLFDRYDLLLTPTMPTEAFAAQGPPPAEIDGHPIPLLGATPFTYPFNLSGHPAITVRAGLTESGLPAGLQIIAPRHRDDLALRAAHAYELIRPWNGRWPENL